MELAMLKWSKLHKDISIYISEEDGITKICMTCKEDSIIFELEQHLITKGIYKIYWAKLFDNMYENMMEDEICFIEKGEKI